MRAVFRTHDGQETKLKAGDFVNIRQIKGPEQGRIDFEIRVFRDGDILTWHHDGKEGKGEDKIIVAYWCAAGFLAAMSLISSLTGLEYELALQGPGSCPCSCFSYILKKPHRSK